MRKITDIYEEYKIIPILQMHQLRVAAVAWQLCDSLDVYLDKESIINACLLHDMGNIIKFDLDQTKLIFGLSDFETSKLKNLQEEFIKKYGNDEEEANAKIARELGMSEEIVKIISENDFRNLGKIKESEDFKSQILKYADLRTGPNGILSYEERMYEAKIRYQNHKKGNMNDDERDKLVNYGKEIEKQIFNHSSIKPEDINDESVKDVIEELKNFEI